MTIEELKSKIKSEIKRLRELSIWWRWFKCEGWIVVLPPLSVALIFLAIKVAASLAAR